MEGEDIGGGFELGDGYEADLGRISMAESAWCGRDKGTFLEHLLAALMREDMLARFSASCFARWGFICISSAIVGVVGGREINAGRR
jgi:hypothetical protein